MEKGIKTIAKRSALSIYLSGQLARMTCVRALSVPRIHAQPAERVHSWFGPKPAAVWPRSLSLPGPLHPTECTTLLHATNTPAAAPPTLDSFWWSHNETSRGHMLLPNKSATRNIGLPSQRTSSGSFRQVARPSRSRGRQATMSQRDCHVVHRFQKAMLSPGYRMSFSPCKTRCEGVRND